MIKQQNICSPSGRLVPIFSANSHTVPSKLTRDLAQAASNAGETVLVIDCNNGALSEEVGITYAQSLEDVFFGNAALSDVEYVAARGQFTTLASGNLDLNVLLGTIAALSLRYDWVFVAVSPGCTPQHVSLAGAGDISLLAYDSRKDHFMRAYWMIDAIRRRFPGFDPVLMSSGDTEMALETAELLSGTITEFLGAAPLYAGHETDRNIADMLLTHMRAAHRLAEAA